MGFLGFCFWLFFVGVGFFGCCCFPVFGFYLFILGDGGVLVVLLGFFLSVIPFWKGISKCSP